MAVLEPGRSTAATAERQAQLALWLRRLLDVLAGALAFAGLTAAALGHPPTAVVGVVAALLLLGLRTA